jgi:Phosphatidylinositol-glycan biosynthesis class S protein
MFYIFIHIRITKHPIAFVYLTARRINDIAPSGFLLPRLSSAGERDRKEEYKMPPSPQAGAGTRTRLLGVLLPFLLAVALGFGPWWHLTSVPRPAASTLSNLLERMSQQTNERQRANLARGQGPAVQLDIAMAFPAATAGEGKETPAEREFSSRLARAVDEEVSRLREAELDALDSGKSASVPLPVWLSTGGSARKVPLGNLGKKLAKALALGGKKVHWDAAEAAVDQVVEGEGKGQNRGKKNAEDTSGGRFSFLVAPFSDVLDGIVSEPNVVRFGSGRTAWVASASGPFSATRASATTKDGAPILSQADTDAVNELAVAIARAAVSRLILQDRTVLDHTGAAKRRGQQQAISMRPAPHFKVLVGLQYLEPVSRDISVLSQHASDFEAAVDQYISPAIGQLHDVANFTLESQVLAPRRLGEKLFRGTDGTGANFSYIPSSRIAAYFNPNALNLDSAETSLSPIIHLLVLVPDVAASSIRICDTAAAASSREAPSCWPVPAYTVPQWGGVVFAERDGERVELAGALRVALAQLRELVGLPPHEPELVVPARDGISRWEVDALVRRSVFSHLASASSSLESLAVIIANLTEMPVPDATVEACELALRLLADADSEISSSQDYVSANRNAGKAYEIAERAFFDPSMLAMLYFPDEHKYAVYALPFFPVAFQLLSAIFAEVKLRREKRKLADNAD